KGFRKSQPGVYDRVQDGWWNLPNREQDRVAQESQGLVADRTKEHLATSDQGILMLRKMIRDSIDAVQQGKDPIGVIRDSNDNGPITFDSSRDAVEALSCTQQEPKIEDRNLRSSIRGRIAERGETDAL